MALELSTNEGEFIGSGQDYLGKFNIQGSLKDSNLNLKKEYLGISEV